MDTQSTAQIRPGWAARFFTIWSGQAFSLLGSQLVSFALIWWLTQTTGKATVLTTASLVGLLPQIFLMPLAGALVDRWNRRVTMIVSDGIIALATLGLAALFAFGQPQIWHIYVLMFIRSVAGGFHYSAMTASTSLMVPQQHLTRVQGANQILQGAMSIGAAPLGASFLLVMPIQGILMIDVGTALLAIMPLFFFSVPQPLQSQAAENPAAKTSVWEDFGAGLRYMWGWPGLLLIGVMATFINLVISPAFSLMPILVTKHFNGEVFQFAMMEMAIGLGVIAGGIVLGVWGGFRRRIYTSLAGLILLGVSALTIGLMPSQGFLAAVAAVAVCGFALPICNGPLHAALQAAVAPEMQGRVFTLVGSVASAMTPLGLIVAGPLSDRFGVSLWYIAGGLGTILLGAGALFVPAIIHFEDGRGEAVKAIPQVSESSGGMALGGVDAE